MRARRMSSANVRALRRLAGIWLLVLATELLLYVVLARSRFLDDLHALPALVTLLAGVLGSVAVLRRRRADRRRADGHAATSR